MTHYHHLYPQTLKRKITKKQFKHTPIKYRTTFVTGKKQQKKLFYKNENYKKEAYGENKKGVLTIDKSTPYNDIYYHQTLTYVKYAPLVPNVQLREQENPPIPYTQTN